MDYFIVSLKWTRKGDPYITFWRADNAGYVWPLSRAGRYTKAAVEAEPDYHNNGIDTFAVPVDAAIAMGVAPKLGTVDGDAGPVIPNTIEAMAALRGLAIPGTIFPALLTKKERVAEANRVLKIISSHGRRFFHYDGRVTRFEVDERGHIWLIDRYTEARIYVAYRGQWKGFSEGGTLKSLCQALRDYIRTGEQISHKWFGPWPQYLCDGDLWGYGAEAMEAVRREVLTTAAVAKPPADQVADHSRSAKAA